jgi:anti-sigma regulatory factor (Ser/Thr protein kinase)
MTVGRVLWCHEIVLPAEPVSVLRARRFVCSHLGEHRLWYLIDDVRLVVSELATNAIRHARTPFTLSMERTEEGVVLTVYDDSPSTLVRVHGDLLEGGGRGLWIVGLVSREWGVREASTGGKSVWASFPTRQ